MSLLGFRVESVLNQKFKVLIPELCNNMLDVQTFSIKIKLHLSKTIIYLSREFYIILNNSILDNIIALNSTLIITSPLPLPTYRLD